MARPSHIEPLFLVGEALGLPLACFDAEGRAIFATSTLKAEIGVEPADLRDLAAAIESDPEVGDAIVARLLALVRPGEQHSAGTNASAERGAARPLELHAIAVGPEEAPAIVVCVHESAVDGALMARVELLERQASAGYVAAGVAHEFNNLLTSMLGWSQIALKAAGPASPAAPAIQTIENNTRRAQRIAAELLGSVRPASDAPRTIDLGRLAAEALRLLSWELNAAHVEVAAELDDGGGVRGDPTRLLQVIVNLVRNAMEAMPARGALRVRSSRDGGSAVLEVVDNGHGIPEAILGRVFEPFFTTKSRRATATGGSGLGLAICKRIVEEHGGTIGIRSRRPGGTTVTISLPASGEGEPDAPKGDLSRSSVPPGVAVLVVDDEPDICEMIRTALELRGASVVSALNGAAAVALCAKERFDAAFLDFSMSGLSGFALGRAIGDAQPGLPIVFMSGVEIPQDPDVRFRSFLKKPFDLREIQCKLHDVLAPE